MDPTRPTLPVGRVGDVETSGEALTALRRRPHEEQAPRSPCRGGRTLRLFDVAAHDVVPNSDRTSDRPYDEQLRSIRPVAHTSQVSFMALRG